MTSQPSLFDASGSCGVCGGRKGRRADPRLGEVCEECRAGSGFDGATYSRPLDQARLATQLDAIRAVLAGGGWWTVSELAARTGAPEPSVSAQLRNLRKAAHGGYPVPKRRRGGLTSALWEFALLEGGAPERRG